MQNHADALEASVERLRALVHELDPRQIVAPAYPSEWTVADVLSHIGSGAVILERRLDDTLGGSTTPPDFAESVWGAWNAMPPQAQAADALLADQSLLHRLGSLSDEERARFQFAMGPMTFDLAGFVGLRLNEHALHTWDIQVAFDPDATVAPASTRIVIDDLQMIVRFAGRPTGTEHQVTVQTTEPRRDFTVTLGAEAVTLTPAGPAEEPDLEIPAEAFVRLVYGRLDPDHAPAVHGSAHLDELRRAFPGA
ncbi:MAG TPA: maleylpyruvate isomerase family mycothiol-dependent enzyme [Acidimicrobiales bacterium]|nr:maleylpyruvate isomerase family mycothiol-dependent enzyme [Acidimicrobiales bacterium]